MKNIVKWLLTAVLVIVGIFIIGGFLIPEQWTATNSIRIAAQPERIFEQVANLRNWQNWAPWNLEKDPTQVYTYEGPELGVGAKWLWTSEKMGKGHLEIKKANVNDGITYELFIDMNNMQSTMTGVMAFATVDGQTEITWTDHGNSGSNLLRRWMSLMISRVLTKEMESGLTKLKALVESAPKAEEEPSEDEPVAEVEEEEEEPNTDA